MTTTGAPKMREDGSCVECIGGWLCEYHQEETERKWNHRQREIAACVDHFAELEIARLCASLELESDEGGTAREKALRIMEAA